MHLFCTNILGRRDRNQQDATNQIFIIKLLSQHVSGIIMPIIRRTRPCLSNSNFHTVHTACDPAPHNHSQHKQCRTSYAVVHSLVLLKIGIMMHKTCWDRSLVINIWLVVSCWFPSLHPTFIMHSHKSLKFSNILTYDVSYMIQTRGYIFWNTAVYTGMV